MYILGLNMRIRVQSSKFSNRITFQMDTSTYIVLVRQAMLHIEDE